MKKFTEEQLSRILSMHANRQLIRTGQTNWISTSILFYNKRDKRMGWGCINQVAYNEPCAHTANFKNEIVSKWFDFNYDYKMTSDELLKVLEELGVA